MVESCETNGNNNFDFKHFLNTAPELIRRVGIVTVLESGSGVHGIMRGEELTYYDASRRTPQKRIEAVRMAGFFVGFAREFWKEPECQPFSVTEQSTVPYHLPSQLSLFH